MREKRGEKAEAKRRSGRKEERVSDWCNVKMRK
jgi:hypothetical protein